MFFRRKKTVATLLTGATMIVSSFLPTMAHSSERLVRLFLDADRSVNTESAVSIERGVMAALAEVSSTVNGFRIEVVPLDHRANVLRSKKNFQTAADDPDGIAVMAGIHSPPLIKNRTFINELGIVTLVPWAAGAPITRHADGENWVYRLSVDDSRAGGALSGFALEKEGCTRPALLLEDTPWGDFNLKTIGTALDARGFSTYQVERFGFNLNAEGAEILILAAQRQGSDCIILVTNAKEGASIVNAAAKLSEQGDIKVISHWGITAGNFEERVSFENRQKVDLNFIQTCFSFYQDDLSERARMALDKARALYPDDISGPADIKAPVGFIHGYDLTRLFIEAMGKLDPSREMKALRADLRTAFENLDAPVTGLVKTYEKPFSRFDSENNVNGHEALGPEHYCMARYNEQGDIIVRTD